MAVCYKTKNLNEIKWETFFQQQKFDQNPIPIENLTFLLHNAQALFGDDQRGDEELCQADPADGHDLCQHCDQVEHLLTGYVAKRHTHLDFWCV